MRKFRFVAAAVVAATLMGAPAASAFDIGDTPTESGFFIPREVEAGPPRKAPKGYEWYAVDTTTCSEDFRQFTGTNGETIYTQECTTHREWRLRRSR